MLEKLSRKLWTKEMFHQFSGGLKKGGVKKNCTLKLGTWKKVAGGGGGRLKKLSRKSRTKARRWNDFRAFGET